MEEGRGHEIYSATDALTSFPRLSLIKMSVIVVRAAAATSATSHPQLAVNAAKLFQREMSFLDFFYKKILGILIK